jgi:hypothetical protein
LETTTFDRDKRKLLSAVSHGSIFLSQLLLSAGIPLALWVISDDPVVKDNAREVLNFHLNVWVYSINFWHLDLGVDWLAIPGATGHFSNCDARAGYPGKLAEPRECLSISLYLSGTLTHRLRTLHNPQDHCKTLGVPANKGFT